MSGLDAERLTAIRERADEVRTTLASWKYPLGIAAARIAELEALVARLEAEAANSELEQAEVQIQLLRAENLSLRRQMEDLNG